MATYLGDTNNGGSSSTPYALSILQASITMTLAANVNPVIVTHPVLLTASLSGNGGKPTGTVIFKTATATLGTAAVSGTGVADLFDDYAAGGARTW